MSNEQSLGSALEVQIAEIIAVVGAVAAPMALCRPDGTFVAVNDSFTELVGADETELVDQPFTSVSYPEDRKDDLAMVHELVSGKRGFGYRTKRYLRPDGQVVWAETFVSVLRGPDGEPVALLAHVRRDDGGTAEQVTLRESEERFRAAFDNAPVGMAVVGVDGEWLQVNLALCTLLGRTMADCAHLVLTDVLHPEQTDRARSIRRTMLLGQTGSVRFDTELLHADGSSVRCDLTATLVRDDAGAPVHFVLHVLERRADDAEPVPMPDEPRIRDIVGSSNDLLFFRLRLRPELRFEHISRSVEALCGYTAEELYADPGLMFQLVHPESSAHLAAALNEPEDGLRHLLVRWRHRSGREVVTNSHHAGWYEDGVLVGVEGALIDISAQRAAEDAHVRSEARFRALVQHSSDAIVVVDRDGRVTYANPTVERLLGWDADDADGASVWQAVHPSDVQTLRSKLQGTAVPFSLRLRTADDEWRWTEAVVTDLLDDPAVAGIVLNARDVHDQRTAEEALRDTAVTDALTRLPNRILIQDRIERTVLRSRGSTTLAAVLVVDIDDFATINRAVGYDGGDQLLVAVAERLVSVVPTTHTVGRFAADEFIVCAESLADIEAARTYADAIRAAISGPLQIGDTSVDVTASVGIAVADTAEMTAEDLLACASSALGQAKTAGGDGHAVYDHATGSLARLRHQREHDLRHALERGQISTHYQPIVDLHDGTTVAAEALMRWHHPTDGTIAPDEFIPIAEARGLIGELTSSVLDDACRQLAAWRSDPHGCAELTMSVNLSAHQLANRSIVETLEATLRKHQLPPEALTVEVTESAAIGYGHLEVLHEIDAVGVAVALDDFGTHYSSLSYVQRLPLKQLKIDRSFVTGIADDRSRRAIVMATAQLARGLDLLTVAEGIEELEEMTELQLFGIDRGQGYLFGRPMTADDFTAHLRSLR